MATALRADGHDVTALTSHWPIWSRPADLARILDEVARRTAP